MDTGVNIREILGAIGVVIAAMVTVLYFFMGRIDKIEDTLKSSIDRLDNRLDNFLIQTKIASPDTDNNFKKNSPIDLTEMGDKRAEESGVKDHIKNNLFEKYAPQLRGLKYEAQIYDKHREIAREFFEGDSEDVIKIKDYFYRNNVYYYIERKIQRNTKTKSASVS